MPLGVHGKTCPVAYSQLWANSAMGSGMLYHGALAALVNSYWFLVNRCENETLKHYQLPSSPDSYRDLLLLLLLFLICHFHASTIASCVWKLPFLEHFTWAYCRSPCMRFQHIKSWRSWAAVATWGSFVKKNYIYNLQHHQVKTFVEKKNTFHNPRGV